MPNTTSETKTLATIHCTVPADVKRKIKARAAEAGHTVPEEVTLTLLAGIAALTQDGAK